MTTSARAPNFAARSPALPVPQADEAWNVTISDREFQALSELILRETGISLGRHKRSLVVSRLGKRLRHLGFRTFAQYHDYLTTRDQTHTELRETINCITTNKTDFFRESHHFDFLQKHLLEPRAEQVRRGGERRLRIWSAACSTGEEPYSVAITIAETVGSIADWDIKILASDIDTNVLRRGEAGIYDERRISTLADRLKRRYFLRRTGSQAGSVPIKPELRRLVFFRRINFVDPQWPINTHFDAILCRNVIIYFNRETQRRLFERLTRYLKPDGYLFVGHSENLQLMNDLVMPIGHTVYRPRPRKEDSGAVSPNTFRRSRSISAGSTSAARRLWSIRCSALVSRPVSSTRTAASAE